MEDLPTEYDEIILGTGLQESILAAGLARIGRAVLHLDRNEYYGGDWATFNLNGLETWIESNQNIPHNDDVMSVDANSLEDGERIVYLSKHGNTISNIVVEWFISEGDPVPERRGPFNRLPTPPPEPNPDIPGEDHSEEVNDQSQSTNQGNADRLAEGVFHQEEPNLEEVSGASSQRTPSTTENVTSDDSHQQDCDSIAHASDGAGISSADVNNLEPSEQTSMDDGATDLPEEECVPEEPMAVEPVPEEPVEAEPEPVHEEPAASQSEEEPTAGADDGPAAEEPVVEARKQWTQNLVKHEWRKFNIDLSPKLMFCRGSLIEALIESRVSRYAEFKAITRTLTYINGKIEKVPCSRADVFSSKYVTMMEKRILMKFIEFCLHYQERRIEYEEYLDKPFIEFLKFKKLTKTLQHFVVHSIAMVTQDTLTEEGLKSMHHFLKSLGRYGNTAFLWTLYGSGELPQCFCRMCAVFNGIYMLRCPGKGLIVDSDNKCKGIISADGQRLICKNVIMDHSYRPSLASSTTTSLVSRAVLMTDRSLLPTEQEEISLLTVPPIEGSPQTVQVIELPYGTYACPKDIFIVHMTCKSSSSTAKKDFQEVCKLLFQPTHADDDPESTKPRIIWSMYFNMADMTGIEDDVLRDGLPGNTEVTSGPGGSIGYEHAVEQAKAIFERLCPGEDFLPAVPDPDDIIIENQSHDNPGHNKPGFEENTTDGSEKADTENKDREEEEHQKNSEETTTENVKEKTEIETEEKEVDGKNETETMNESESKAMNESESETMKYKQTNVADENL